VTKILLLLICLSFSTNVIAQQKVAKDQTATDLKEDEQKSSASELELINFKVYPNPTQNSLTVSFDKLNGGMSFQINDVLGKLVYRRKLVSHDLQKDNFKLDMSSFKSGIYMFSMRSKTTSRTIKVVKL